MSKWFYEILYGRFRAPWDIGPRLYCFEWEMRWWERLLTKLFSAFGSVMEPGEVEQRFSPYFEIAKIAEHSEDSGWSRGEAVYLMTRQLGRSM